MRFAIALLVTAACWAQNPSVNPTTVGKEYGQGELAKPSTKPAPAITIEQQAEWLQSRGDMLEAQVALKAAEARMQAIVAQMQAVCPLQMSKTGRPECVPEKTKEKDK